MCSIRTAVKTGNTLSVILHNRDSFISLTMTTQTIYVSLGQPSVSQMQNVNPLMCSAANLQSAKSTVHPHLYPFQAGKLSALTESVTRCKCTLPDLNIASGVSLAEEYTSVGVRSWNTLCWPGAEPRKQQFRRHSMCIKKYSHVYRTYRNTVFKKYFLVIATSEAIQERSEIRCTSTARRHLACCENSR